MNNDQMREFLKSYRDSDLKSLIAYKGNKKKFNTYLELMEVENNTPMPVTMPSGDIINIKTEFNIPISQFETWVTDPYYRNSGDLSYLSILHFLSIDTNRVFKMRKKYSKTEGQKYERVGDMPLIFNTLLLEYIATNDDLSKLTDKTYYLTSNILNEYKSDSRTDYLNQNIKSMKYKLIKPEGATKFTKSTIFDIIIYNRFPLKDSKDGATRLANIITGFETSSVTLSDYMPTVLVKDMTDIKLNMELKRLKSALNPNLTLESMLEVGRIGEIILSPNFSIYNKRSQIKTLLVLMHILSYAHGGFEDSIKNILEIVKLCDNELSPVQICHFIISHKNDIYIPASSYSRRFDTLGEMEEFVHKAASELYS